MNVARFDVAGADAYERAIGRWSRKLAPLFAEFCGSLAGSVLDIGCGTGILTGQLLALGRAARVTGIDIQPPLLERARAAVTDSRASFGVADAARLPFAKDSFDHAVSLLVVNFLADRLACVREAMRVTRPGGTIAATVWDLRGGFVYSRFAWDIAAAQDPAAAKERDALFRTPILRPGALEALWREAGLADLRTDALHIDMTYADFDDFWSPLLASGQAFARYFAAQTLARQADLRDAVRAAWLAGDIDGPRSCVARAFAVAGRVRR